MSRLRAVAALALTHHDRGLRALPVPGPTQRAILAANACTVLALLQPLGVTPRLNEYAGTVGLILGFLALLVLSAGGVFVSWLLTWRRIRDGSLARIHRCRFEAGDFSGAVTSALSGHVGTSGP